MNNSRTGGPLPPRLPERDSRERPARHRWRALGVAFLLLLPLAAVIGLVETLLSPPRFTATAGELLYGVNLHWLIALVAVLLARLVLWPVHDRSFPPAAIGALAVVELAVVASYWVGIASWAPPLARTTGKLFLMGVVGLGLAVGLGLGLAAARFMRGGLWARGAHSAAAPVGLGLAALLLAANGTLLARAWPRAQAAIVRPEADRLARPDVIVILVDTLRRDHLSAFGYPRPTSPNIDRLLAESHVFSAAYAPSNKTIPSIASLFTGLYPTSCGVRGPFEAIPEEAPTLAEHFRSYGYRTGAFVANLIVTRQGGYAQGFETYFPSGAPWWTYRRRTAVELIALRLARPADADRAPRINRTFLDWLAAGEGQPILAYLHYMEPHSPYAPGHEDLAAVAPGAPWGPSVPPLYQNFSHADGRGASDCIDWECLDEAPSLPAEQADGMVARYDGEIRALDRHLGQLLEELEARGVLDRAHLLFLTDHGEQFGDHGGWYHGHAIYDELVASPMAYRPPGGLAQDRVIDRPVAMLDLLRTLFPLIGLEPPPLHQGREIEELLATPAQAAPGAARAPAGPRFAVPVLSELPPQLYALRMGPWKLVRRGPADAPVWRLFDLARDPGEIVDLAPALPDTLSLMQAHLHAMLAGLEEQRLDRLERSLDPEALEELRGLGYIR